MRHSIPATVFLSVSLMFAVFGCEDIDSYDEGDSDLLDTPAKVKAANETICDFGSPSITLGNTYAVSILNGDLKKDKDYFLEIQIDGVSLSPSIVVQVDGTMAIDIEAKVVGFGAISVYETKIEKGKEERKITAICTFEAEDIDIDTSDTPDIDDIAEPRDASDTGDTDLCPYDPYKTEPGECGCGVAEGTCGPDDGEYCGPLDEDYDTSFEKFANQFCSLCKDGSLPLQDRGRYHVNSNQLSCDMLMMEMANPNNASKPNSETCHALQRQYRDACCNPECTPRPLEKD